MIGVVLGLGGAILLALWQGPPVAADPLSASWNYSIAPGNYVEFSGAVTGGDYVTGNFTVVTPPGALVVLEVFNSTEYTQFVNGKPSVPASPPVNATKGLIDFAAIVTDNYYFVWVNPYTPGTHITLGLHAQTQYMSNVVVE